MTPVTVADVALRQVKRDAASAKSAHARAEAWDQLLYAQMRKAHDQGASYAQIADAAGCSKTWVSDIITGKKS